MKNTAAILSGLVACVAAKPIAYPQVVDFAGILSSAGPVSSAVMATGVQSQVVSIDASSVISAAAAAATLDPLVFSSSVISASTTALARRTVSASCGTPIATGAGPQVTPDTASAFTAYPAFSQAAVQAETPAGYTEVFQNLDASNNAYGYLGFTTLSSYDVEECANLCNNIFGCISFNIYFERDPAYAPTSSCPDPSSTTEIKCVWWGGPVSQSNAVNSGQWQDDFQVVIAGSNGYVNTTLHVPDGYTETVLGEASINAPDDCNGANTYMGVKFWNDGLFIPARCTAHCEATSAYDVAHFAEPMTCQFVNTYLLSENNVVQGQVCAMYNETWSSTYADNTGYTWESDVYTISYSYTYSNATNPGTCFEPCEESSSTGSTINPRSPAAIANSEFEAMLKREVTGI